MQQLSPRHIFHAQALTYGATVPLVAAVCAVFFKLEQDVLTVNVLDMVRIYTGVILSFLSGAHWAAFVIYGSKCPRNLLLTSAATAFLAWTALMLPDLKIALALQSLSLLYMLVLDWRLKEAKILPIWCYAMRHNATAISVVCLMMLELS